MDNELTAAIKLAAYFQWEYTGYGNALNHWHCAEDIACFLESYHVLTPENIGVILENGSEDLGYIEFVRNIAFKVYIYTNNPDADANWFIAERLLNNGEWSRAVTFAAQKYHLHKSEHDFTQSVRSDAVKNFYQAHRD